MAVHSRRTSRTPPATAPSSRLRTFESPPGAARCANPTPTVIAVLAANSVTANSACEGHIMKILVYSSLLLILLAAPFLGCGSSTNNSDAAHGSAGGSGGTLSDDAATGGVGATGGSGGSLLPIPMDSDVPPTGAVDGGTCNAPIDCTGLSPAQCHDRILNPLCLPDGVVPQEPGPDPTVPYPACSAI